MRYLSRDLWSWGLLMGGGCKGAWLEDLGSWHCVIRRSETFCPQAWVEGSEGLGSQWDWNLICPQKDGLRKKRSAGLT